MEAISWLRSSQGFWESVEIAGEILVILGVIVEHIAEPIRNEERRKKYKRAATALFIIGLSFGILGIFTTSRLSDEKIAVLNEEAAKANAAAGVANEHAADLESRAVHAEKETAYAWAMLEPRELTPDSTSALIPELKRLGPQNLDIVELSSEAEVKRFAVSLSGCARQAGWDVKIFDDPLVPPQIPIFRGWGLRLGGDAMLVAITLRDLGQLIPFVRIQTVEGSDKNAELAGKAISRSLNAQKIVCVDLDEHPLASGKPQKIPESATCRETRIDLPEMYREPKKHTAIQIIIGAKTGLTFDLPSAPQ